MCKCMYVQWFIFTGMVCYWDEKEESCQSSLLFAKVQHM